MDDPTRRNILKGGAAAAAMAAMPRVFAQQASLELRPGSPLLRTSDQAERPVHVNLEGESDHEGATSYIALVDKDRNMVSFEPSLHSGFGTGVVMGNTGIIFNCRGDYYSLVEVKRMRSSRASGRAARCRARW